MSTPKNITLNFFGETVSLSSPQSLESLRNSISSLFYFSPEDAKEILLTYNENGDRLVIENDEDLKAFLNSAITIIDLDISQKGYFQCYKMKTKSNLISFITGTKIIKVPYIIFIDENYYYMAKDKIVNQRKPYLRRIGNKYDLLKLSNFQTTKKGNDYEFAFEFVNEDVFDRTFKLLYFTPKEAIDFYTVLHAILGGFGITIPEHLEIDDDDDEEEEDEEGEEYEDEEEEEREGEGERERVGEGEGKGKREGVEEGKPGQNENNIKNDKDEDKKEDEKEENDNNEEKKEENEIKEGTESTKEESKEIRDVEVENEKEKLKNENKKLNIRIKKLMEENL